MNRGDRVHLRTDFGPCSAGDEGIVRHVDQDGNVTVEITHRADCTPMIFLLPPAPASRFALGGQCDGAQVARPARALMTAGAATRSPKAPKKAKRPKRKPLKRKPPKRKRRG